MTIQELCNLSLEELDKMSFSQLEDFFRPMWPVTRPVRKSETSPNQSNIVSGGQRKGKGKMKPTTVDELKFQAALTPEKRAFLIEMGLMK